MDLDPVATLNAALSSDPIATLNASISGWTGGWYAGLEERKRVYERLYRSFQVRVEDAYTFWGNLVGTHNERGGGLPPGYRSKEFHEYYALFQTKNLLPPDWSAADERKLFKTAEKNIHSALEKSDISKTIGYSELTVLRSMSQAVLGPGGSRVDVR